MSAIRIPLALLCCLVLLPQSALAQNTLPHSRSYLVTGDYAVGGVDVTGPGVNGFVTGAIPMSGVPANADVLAAFLYWETIATAANLSEAAGVQFRGVPIDIDNTAKVKKTSSSIAGQTASCFSSGSPVTMLHFRADVLTLLPEQLDVNGAPTGRRIVNTADLIARGLPEHLVKLPKVGTGAPESAGATLLVVFRNPEPDSPQNPNPLRKIVVYDGIKIQPPGGTMTQSLRGFYKSAAIKSARLTHIASTGQKNQTEPIAFNGTQLSTKPFPDSVTPVSERAWGNPTFNVSSLMPGPNSVQYGETATMSTGQHIEPAYECLSWGAVVFSTAVADVDRDGIPDGLEDAVGGLLDPNGDPLPNLNAMGATSLHKDVFVEINAMLAAPGTTYGSADAPYSSTLTQKTDPLGHLHMPRPEVLRKVGEALRDAPFTNADGTPGIKVHFDVGNIQDYHCLTGSCQSVEANEYLVPTALARGGELIQEAACVQTETDPCQFEDYPGTVGWKVGLEKHRDGPVGDNGEELLTTAQIEAWLAGSVNRQRFDPERRGLFHYMLYAHARGTPRSPQPCLDSNGDPAPYDNGVCTVAPNPRFHVPTTASGKADLPGGDSLISLGFWDNFIGTAFVQASTTLHELGHNWDLWHGGLRGKPGDVFLGTSNFVEPNCKSNHLSVMSYLFQANGMLDVEGDAHIDFSGDIYPSIDETSLLDASLPTPLRYRTSWFAPLLPGTLGITLGAPPMRSYCSGGRVPNPLPPGWIDAGRIDALSIDGPIDWNADGDAIDSAFQQDVNFDGVLTGAFANPVTPAFQGANDWANLRLDQTGAGRSAGGYSSGGLGFDADSGGLGFDGDTGGLGFDADSGGLGFDADSGGLGFDADSGGLGFDADTGGQELELEVVRLWSNTPPTGFRACALGIDCPGVQPGPGSPEYHHAQVRWTDPHVRDGGVAEYRIERALGATVTPASVFAQVGTSTTTTFVDTQELPNNYPLTYFVRAVSIDGIVSGPSNLRTFTGVNDPPVAHTNRYNTTGPLVVSAATGVLANDTDVDSPPSSLRARLVSGPSSGSLTFNADGSFTFVPATGFKGNVTFVYVANNGTWSLDPSVPMSVDSNPATVTINVRK